VVLKNPESSSHPGLQIFDTEQGAMAESTPTAFFFSPAHQGGYEPHFLIEPCGYIPSPDELATAPFYPDRSQRILAVYSGFNTCCVINAGLLLELARERNGEDVWWDEWGARTIEVCGGDDCFGLIWVSGCRLFSTVSDSAYGICPTYLQVYDFSHVGRGEHLHTPDRASEGGGTRRFSPSLDGYRLPWDFPDSWNMDLAAGHDSLVFCTVSIPVFLFTVE
jgi:hypothetical protein